MGTAYFLRRINPKTAQVQNELIGHSGSGAFQFEAYPEKGIVSFEAWHHQLQQENSAIVSDKEIPIQLKEFITHVHAMAKRAVHKLYTCAPAVTNLEQITPKVEYYLDEKGHLFHCAN